jgi:3-oxoacyl-[acyl-carrier-protein] synthase III
VDWLLLHQANIRIMDIVAERLGLPAEKVRNTMRIPRTQELPI